MRGAGKIFIVGAIVALLVVGCNNVSNESNTPNNSNEPNVESLNVLMNAADQGNVEAQYNLGCCYYNGDGVAQDYTEAVKWWQKAADQGYEPAQEMLQNLGY